MGGAQLVRPDQKNLNQVEKKPDERELLLRIVRLQTMLNSKMFEFMRSYQKQHNWGGDEHIFRDGSGGKTWTARLFDEVNGIGFSLSEAVSALVGENLHEKRDEQGRVLARCRVCEKETAFVQVINAPYGITGAYMDGSERLTCSVCRKDTIYPGDERLPKFNSVFKTK